MQKSRYFYHRNPLYLTARGAFLESQCKVTKNQEYNVLNAKKIRIKIWFVDFCFVFRLVMMCANTVLRRCAWGECGGKGGKYFHFLPLKKFNQKVRFREKVTPYRHLFEPLRPMRPTLFRQNRTLRTIKRHLLHTKPYRFAPQTDTLSPPKR